MRTNNKIMDELKAKWGYRRRLLGIATALVFTIAVLAIVQWAIGTRGWGLMAGLLTIVMVALGFGLAGAVVRAFRSRPLKGEVERSRPRRSKPRWETMMDEGLENDPHVLGSAMYRGGDD